MFKVNNKATERHQWYHRSGVFIVNFEHISHNFLVFLLLLKTEKCLLSFMYIKWTKSYNLRYDRIWRSQQINEFFRHQFHKHHWWQIWIQRTSWRRHHQHSLHTIPYSYLLSWYGRFAEICSSCIVSSNPTKALGKRVFPQYFHTRKLGKIPVLYVVILVKKVLAYYLTLLKYFKNIFLYCAQTIYSEKHINQKVEVLIHVFVETGHSRSFFENLVHIYQTMKKKNDKNNCFNNV